MCAAGNLPQLSSMPGAAATSQDIDLAHFVSAQHQWQSQSQQGQHHGDTYSIGTLPAAQYTFASQPGAGAADGGGDAGANDGGGDHNTAKSDPGGGDDERSTGSKSTLILQQLLELKGQAAQAQQQQATLGKGNVDPHDVQDVENMLEAYTLQVTHLHHFYKSISTSIVHHQYFDFIFQIKALELKYSCVVDMWWQHSMCSSCFA